MSAQRHRETLQPSSSGPVWLRTRIQAAALCAIALTAAVLADPARAGTTVGAAPTCTLSDFDLGQILPRTRHQLANGRELTIVAIGSSSTEGAGASSASAAYPARLEALLSARLPGVRIRVLNRGIGGEEEADMLARFDRDVIAEKPDLVLWQVASNAIMRDRQLAAQEDLLRAGIARIKRSGADAVLIDPQYTTAIIAHAVALPMVDLVAEQARHHQVATFRRFALMRDWHESQRIPFEAFSIADGLHMNDWGYDCLARNLAAAIARSAAPPALASMTQADVSDGFH